MAAKAPSLDSLLECPICLGECEDPRVLTCLHTFCLKCLDRHINTSADCNRFLCPTCRQNCEVPAEGATSLPRNFFLNSLKAILQQQGSQKKVASQSSALQIEQQECSDSEKEIIDREESRGLLSKLTQTAKNISSRLQENLQELGASEKAINTDCDEACRQVQENAEEIRALVTKREKSAVQEIRLAKTTALTQLTAAYKEAEINKAAVESLLPYIQALQVSEDVTSQVVYALREQLRQHEVAPLQSVSLEVNLERKIQHEVAPLQSVSLEVNLERKIQSLSALKAMQGDVSFVHQTTKTRDSPGDTISDEMKVSLSSPLLDLEPDIKTTISGLVVVGDCVCVTGIEEPYLWIHNMGTNTNRRTTLHGLDARGMTLVHDDTLVITDVNRKLHLIKIDQEMKMTEHVVKDLPFQPYSVTADTARDKLVVVNSTDIAIVVCDGQGNVESQIKVEKRLSCAAATGDGYVGLDLDGNQLNWFSRNGDVIHTYSESLSGFHSIVDSLGRVIIADCNHHKLHLVDANKKLSHYLLTEHDGIVGPRRVYLDEVNARLCVGHYNETSRTYYKVSVYKWPFVSPSSSPGGYTSLTHYKLRLELNRYQ